jgi:uncharacterized protein with von Willebrand factor type A (vWA) domain
MVNNSNNIKKQKRIVDHHCLNFLLFFDVGGIVDHHCSNFLLFFDVGGIIDHHFLNFLLFC